MEDEKNNNKDCVYYADKYTNKIEIELKGCSVNYIINKTIFSTFNNLSVYFPDAYKHMLKVWGVENE